MDGQRDRSGYRELRSDLERRTKRFALQVLRTVNSLPSGFATSVVGRQLIHSATAVGANYRSAARARSRPDFISKIGIAEEEADESQYWLELLHELNLLAESEFTALHQEARELTAILVTSGRTAKFGRGDAKS
jgi:four helix bundle protein